MKNINGNQLIVGVEIRGCVGEEAMLGWNRWGGRLLVVWGDKLMNENIERWAGTLGLRWPTTNQKSALTVGETLEGRQDRGGTCGRALLHCSGRLSNN